MTTSARSVRTVSFSSSTLPFPIYVAGSGRRRCCTTSSSTRAPAETASSRSSSSALWPTRMAFSTKLGLQRRCGCSLGHRDGRDGVLEDQLILIVRFQHNRVLVKPTDLPDQTNTADQENRHRNLIASHGVEIDVLNILGGRSFVLHFRLHKIHQERGLRY